MRMLGLLVALLACAFAAAQSERPRMVNVDVVVTDQAGNPLTELGRDDFELYEDGKRVDIISFSRRDLGNYYSLAYSGDARRISVKVNVDGARVAVSDPEIEEAPASPDITAANPLGVVVEVAPGSSADHNLLNFRLTLHIETLTFVPNEDDTMRRADFVTTFELVAKDGRAFPLESRDQSLKISEAELADAATDYVDYSWQLDLSPLRFPEKLRSLREGMQLRATVEDRASGKRSVVTAPLFNKRPRLFSH